jgi:glucose/arabinose dehydrogenase
MHPRDSAFVSLALLALSACGGQSPPSPTPGSGTGESITGRERLGWDQPAAGASELATFGYAIYADGVRSTIVDISCSGTATSAGFACSGRLPALQAGAHALELATFLAGDPSQESPRSASFRVVVTASTADVPAPAWRTDLVETAGDGTRLRVERLVDGVAEATDGAFAPDGRLFLAERAGRVSVVDSDFQAAPALQLDDVEAIGRNGLLALALDPDFDRTHYLFLVYTTRSSSGAAVFRLARFRELRGTLAERAILLDGVPARPDSAAASLRFGPDGLIYLALGDAGEEPKPSSFNGKVLRLKNDGRTPPDQAAASPVLLDGVLSPRGLGFQPGSGLLLLADENKEPADSVTVLAMRAGPPVRADLRGRIALGEAGAAGIAIVTGDLIPNWRNDLLIASDEGRHITRLRFSPDDPARIVSTDRLLQDRVGGVRVVTIGPDGAIYFCTAEALGRLLPR